MKVNVEPFEDPGEKSAQGYHDYRYSGTIFTFRDGKDGLIARSYAEERQEAHFLAWLDGKKRLLFSEIPYSNRLFRDAVSYLIEKIQVRRISVLLSNGYLPVELTKLEMVTKNESP